MPLNFFNSFCLSELNLLWLFLFSTLGVYSLFISGWASNSKYSLLGSIRAIIQLVSYDISLSFIIFPIIFLAGSLHLLELAFYQSFLNVSNYSCYLILSWCFIFSLLAETNRAPFDLPEAEAELVAGYNVEYSSLPFAYFFLGEYLNIVLMSLLFLFLFLSGNFYFNDSFFIFNIKLIFKLTLIIYFIILTRASLPRIRYDFLILFCWKYLLFFSSSFFIFFLSNFFLLITIIDLNSLTFFNCYTHCHFFFCFIW